MKSILQRGPNLQLRLIRAFLHDDPVVLLAHYRRCGESWEFDPKADKLALEPKELDTVIEALQKARSEMPGGPR